MISKKYARANNKYIDGYDDAKQNSYNNLYGWAMSQPLPTGLMCWLDEDETKSFNLQNISPDADKGYMLEVDLEYPHDLHDLHNSYPLAPSSYSKFLYRDLYGEHRKRPNTTKLIPTLENKKNYITHYRNLQLYTNLGMKITKVHRILEFHQSPWLATYIQFNTSRRQEARNDFEKNFFKLMCNSVFGKTMENLRNRVNIKLVNNESSLKKCVSRPSFERFQIFNEDLVGVENKHINLLLNKPVYVGSVILELSKIIMYDFHYNVMQEKYGGNLNLLFTDTDSLCYEIYTDDVYDDMNSFLNYFDTSNYQPSDQLHSTIYKRVPGKMKDEMAGVPIKEFIGLRPKMYSLIYDIKNGGELLEKEKRTAKGVAKCAIDKQIRHIHYKQCLVDNKMTINDMDLIRSENHTLYINNVRKVGLCNFDDKRFWKNSINSYSYGHFRIPNVNKCCSIYC
ncbi:unnamed protein product [Mytilus edulis]|uniref:DNA-directed DNA polymerase n=1 Tax=Mytilus edulis TaxID=6550 RepID=A0A8S3VEX4_MYTED|nr:unnamed protein product [Mytilus edulis]